MTGTRHSHHARAAAYQDALAQIAALLEPADYATVVRALQAAIEADRSTSPGNAALWVLYRLQAREPLAETLAALRARAGSWAVTG